MPIIGMAKAEIFTLKPRILINHAVVVVPMLAPKITPNDWDKLSRPALANPTTITVVAEDD